MLALAVALAVTLIVWRYRRCVRQLRQDAGRRDDGTLLICSHDPSSFARDVDALRQLDIITAADMVGEMHRVRDEIAADIRTSELMIAPTPPTAPPRPYCTWSRAARQ